MGVHSAIGIALVALSLVAATASAQEAGAPEPTAADLFFTYCGACHGVQGEGDGPAAAEAEYAPPDLTRIAIRNGGEFPRDRIFHIVEGRDPVKGHGGPDMPRWGDIFRTREDGFDQKKAEETIWRIVDHIASIQKEN